MKYGVVVIVSEDETVRFLRYCVVQDSSKIYHKLHGILSDHLLELSGKDYMPATISFVIPVSSVMKASISYLGRIS